mgnify:CR=1 FL=1|tara:strand:+ start:1520 stop:1699 length:180 start_codon:yes stop_codon:yes gene_type:complete
MRCYNCKKIIVIAGEHTYEDYGNDLTEGIVLNYICNNEQCNVEKILIFQLNQIINNLKL